MKRLLSIVVSIGLLFLLYRAVDFQGTLNLLKNYNPYSLSLSLLLSIPIFFFHCLRLNILCRPFFKLKNALSFKLISLALSLNLILPAKLGDIGKAYFL